MIRAASSPREVFSIIELHGADFDEIHAATCLYVLARKAPMLTPEEAKSRVLLDLVDFVDFHTPGMMPYTLANLAWSVARLRPAMGPEIEKLLPPIADASMQTIRSLSPRDLSNLAWAYGAMRQGNPPLFRKIADQSILTLDRFNNRDLANLVWAFAAVKERSVQLFRKTADVIIERIAASAGQFNPQDLGNIAWSYGFLGMHEPQLIRALCVAMQKVSSQARTGSDLVFNWATLLLVAADSRVVDQTIIVPCASDILQPGVLRRASDYSVSTLTRSAEKDGWRERKPELHRALREEVRRRGITEAALQSDLIGDPPAWDAAFG